MTFKPVYPCPHASRNSLIKRFFTGCHSWLHVLFEKSYSMKIGYVRLPKARLFMPCEENLVKRVMKTEWSDFPKHHALGEVLKPLLGESIFTTNGEQWQRQREMMNPSFAHTRLQSVFPLMSDAIMEMIERFKKIDSSKPYNIEVEMTHVTADIIFRTILSHPLQGAEAEEIFNAFNKFQKITQKIMSLGVYGLPIFFMRKKNEKAAKQIKNILARIIKKRYDEFYSDAPSKPEYKDILSALLAAKDPNTNQPFSYNELVDHVSMLFLAGHETSASALTWSFYLIANCPHTQKKLFEEISAAAANNQNNEIDFEAIKKLDFTKNVFKEALRLYPPVGFFMREAAKDTKMLTKNVCKGDMVMVSPWLIHRNKNQWKEAELFKPERFEQEESKKSIECSYLPFGAGPRICIGAGFATQEAILILANMVKNFEFKNPEGFTPEPVGRVTIRPKDGVELYITPRG